VGHFLSDDFQERTMSNAIVDDDLEPATCVLTVNEAIHECRQHGRVVVPVHNGFYLDQYRDTVFCACDGESLAEYGHCPFRHAWILRCSCQSCRARFAFCEFCLRSKRPFGDDYISALKQPRISAEPFVKAGLLARVDHQFFSHELLVNVPEMPTALIEAIDDFSIYGSRPMLTLKRVA
jgi:hypothetical protein